MVKLHVMGNLPVKAQLASKGEPAVDIHVNGHVVRLVRVHVVDGRLVGLLVRVQLVYQHVVDIPAKVHVNKHVAGQLVRILVGKHVAGQLVKTLVRKPAMDLVATHLVTNVGLEKKSGFVSVKIVYLNLHVQMEILAGIFIHPFGIISWDGENLSI